MSEWRSRDHLAELWVAGKLVDAGWNVYFPHRDKGFDLIATYTSDGQIRIRPIQVKGKRYQLEMPALRHVYGDEDMAAILTYIRGAWGNSASAVTVDAVREARSRTAQRGDSWTAEELGSP